WVGGSKLPTTTEYVPVSGSSRTSDSGFVVLSTNWISLPFGSMRSNVRSGSGLPVVVLSASTKISTTWPAVPANVNVDVRFSGAVPTPVAIGAPTGVGGFGSNGSFHWNTIVLPLANWIVCAISTFPAGAKL